ncbi:hypothetical protein PIB30_044399, partial [Stylosanthes scabra]|nr:hypothetical protein [Stylosanthes scabra]
MHPPFFPPRYLVRVIVPSSASVADRPTFTLNLPRNAVAIEFDEDGTCDMRFVLLGKQGFCVKLSVHKELLREKSSFFAEKFSELGGISSCLQIEDREDVEIYVEAISLIYFKEMKQRLMKQHVSRILGTFKKTIDGTGSYLGPNTTSSVQGPIFDSLENALGKFDDGPFFLGQFSWVDIAYVPFIERFQLVFAEVFKHDITEGRPKLRAFIE